MEATPIPEPVSLLKGRNKMPEEINTIILNTSKYLKHQMPNKNDTLISNAYHVSMCTGISENTVLNLLRKEKNKETGAVRIPLRDKNAPSTAEIHRKKQFAKVDDFVKDLIRRKIYDHHKKNKVRFTLLPSFIFKKNPIFICKLNASLKFIALYYNQLTARIE